MSSELTFDDDYFDNEWAQPGWRDNAVEYLKKKKGYYLETTSTVQKRAITRYINSKLERREHRWVLEHVRRQVEKKKLSNEEKVFDKLILQGDLDPSDLIRRTYDKAADLRVQVALKQNQLKSVATNDLEEDSWGLPPPRRATTPLLTADHPIPTKTSKATQLKQLGVISKRKANTPQFMNLSKPVQKAAVIVPSPGTGITKTSSQKQRIYERKRRLTELAEREASRASVLASVDSPNRSAIINEYRRELEAEGNVSRRVRGQPPRQYSIATAMVYRPQREAKMAHYAELAGFTMKEVKTMSLNEFMKFDKGFESWLLLMQTLSVKNGYETQADDEFLESAYGITHHRDDDDTLLQTDEGYAGGDGSDSSSWELSDITDFDYLSKMVDEEVFARSDLILPSTTVDEIIDDIVRKEVKDHNLSADPWDSPLEFASNVKQKKVPFAAKPKVYNPRSEPLYFSDDDYEIDENKEVDEAVTEVLSRHSSSTSSSSYSPVLNVNPGFVPQNVGAHDFFAIRALDSSSEENEGSFEIAPIETDYRPYHSSSSSSSSLRFDSLPATPIVAPSQSYTQSQTQKEWREPSQALSQALDWTASQQPSQHNIQGTQENIAYELENIALPMAVKRNIEELKGKIKAVAGVIPANLITRFEDPLDESVKNITVDIVNHLANSFSHVPHFPSTNLEQRIDQTAIKADVNSSSILDSATYAKSMLLVLMIRLWKQLDTGSPRFVRANSRTLKVIEEYVSGQIDEHTTLLFLVNNSVEK